MNDLEKKCKLYSFFPGKYTDVLQNYETI